MSPTDHFSSNTSLAGRLLVPRALRNRLRSWSTLGSNLALAAVVTFVGGCESAQQGAGSGAGIGAVSGLAIGSLSGNAGRGAAAGAMIGGVGGAAIGDQNRRRNEEASRQTTQSSQTTVVQQHRVAAAPAGRPAAPVQPPGRTVTGQQPYQTGSALGRLVGQWSVSGTMDVGHGAVLPIHGTAQATVDMNYFVRIGLHFTDPRTGEMVDGTSIISQTGQRGVEMTSSFSSSPDVRTYRGTMDPSGNVLDFNQVSPANSSRRVVMRLSPGIEWTAEVWDRGTRMESYTFTWMGF